MPYFYCQYRIKFIDKRIRRRFKKKKNYTNSNILILFRIQISEFLWYTHSLLHFIQTALQIPKLMLFVILFYFIYFFFFWFKYEHILNLRTDSKQFSKNEGVKKREKRAIKHENLQKHNIKYQSMIQVTDKKRKKEKRCYKTESRYLSKTLPHF